jgi:hypothetical protein
MPSDSDSEEVPEKEMKTMNLDDSSSEEEAPRLTRKEREAQEAAAKVRFCHCIFGHGA